MKQKNINSATRIQVTLTVALLLFIVSGTGIGAALFFPSGKGENIYAAYISYFLFAVSLIIITVLIIKLNNKIVLSEKDFVSYLAAYIRPSKIRITKLYNANRAINDKAAKAKNHLREIYIKNAGKNRK